MTTLPREDHLVSAIESLNLNGASILAQVIPLAQIPEIIARLPDLTNAGTRTLLSTQIGQELAQQLLPIAQAAIGSSAYPARAILFDKSPTTNWNLGYHQDTKIPVREKHEMPGYTHWSVKEGIPHCRPPAEFLANMVALRVAIDANDDTNGPLLVSPTTHMRGFISADETNGIVEEKGQLQALTEPGDVVLMKPLTLHASGKSTSPNRRRVIHIEYAGQPLPSPIQYFF